MTKAPISSRCIAFIIDLAVLFGAYVGVCLAALAGYRLGSGRLTFINLSCILFLSSLFICLIFLFYFTFLTTREGMTFGKAIMNIKVVCAEGRQKGNGPGFVRSLVRTVAYGLSALPCFIGFIMALFFDGRTLHDLLAGTEVVRIEKTETEGGPFPENQIPGQKPEEAL